MWCHCDTTPRREWYHCVHSHYHRAGDTLHSAQGAKYVTLASPAGEWPGVTGRGCRWTRGYKSLAPHGVVALMRGRFGITLAIIVFEVYQTAVFPVTLAIVVGTA